MKKVETNEKSLLNVDHSTRASSVPPAPPPGMPPPPPRPLSPAMIKHGPKDPDARVLLMETIKAGNFKLRKTEVNDKSGLILDDEQRNIRAKSTPLVPPPPPPGLTAPNDAR